jgi:hypothetical protein
MMISNMIVPHCLTDAIRANLGFRPVSSQPQNGFVGRPHPGGAEPKQTVRRWGCVIFFSGRGTRRTLAKLPDRNDREAFTGAGLVLTGPKE